MSSVRINFYQFCSETTIHGLNHIKPEQSVILKIIWLIVFSLSFCGAVSGFGYLVNYYLSNPTATEYRIVTERNLHLPSIVICTSNAFNNTRIRQLGISSDLSRVFGRVLTSRRFPFLFESEGNFSELLERTREEYETLKTRLKAPDFGRIAAKILSQCGDVIESCRDNKQQVDCCSNASWVPWAFGTCFILQSPTRLWGSMGAFEILLRFPRPEELFLTSHAIFASSLHFSVSEHEHMGRNYPLLKPGHYNIANLALTKIESVNNPPEFTCLERPPKDYDSFQCHVTCARESWSKVCGCERLGLSSDAIEMDSDLMPSTGHICDPWEIVLCETNASLVAPEFCHKPCPPPCFRNIYDIKMIHNEFNKDALNAFMDNSSRLQEILHYRAILVVHFDKMEYVHIRQYFSMGVATVLANLGGQWGLFLGGSILTVFHLIVFLLQCTCCCRAETARKDSASVMTVVKLC